MTYAKAFIISLLYLMPGVCSYSQQTITDSLISPSSLKQLVAILASDSLKGRSTGSMEAKKAADFIATEFYRAGIPSVEGNNGYLVPFEYSAGEHCFNVVAGLAGKTKPQELVIFSAHYDHVGTRSNTDKVYGKQSDSDSIYNGANDNASGVSGLITLARYFAAKRDNERSLIFVAFSGEELGLLGSKALAAAIDSSSVVAQVNLEMLGRVKTTKYKSAYITGAEYSNLREILNNHLYQTDSAHYNEAYFTNDRPYRSLRLFERSDNYPFAEKGITAHTIAATSPMDRYYHSAEDETGTLDFESMADIIRAIAIATGGLVNGTDTPKRSR